MAKYVTRTRQSNNPDTLPWGYKQDEYDPELFLPIDEALDELYKALDMYRKVGGTGHGKGYRRFAEILSMRSGIPISHQAFKVKFEEYRANKYKKPLANE